MNIYAATERQLARLDIAGPQTSKVASYSNLRKS